MALIDAKSFEDWRNLQLQKFKEVEPNININPDSMVYMDASVMAEVLYLLQQDSITLTNNSFLAYATGDELTNLGADRSVVRRNAASSTGVASFSRATLATVDYPISAGTRISTQPSGSDGAVVSYETTTDAVLYGLVAVPGAVTTNLLTTGGTMIDGIYHYRITAVAGDGKETSIGPYTTITISNGLTVNRVSLTWTAVSLAVSYNVYLGVGGGNENVIFKLANTVTASYIDTTGTTSGSITPPVSNSTGNLSVDVAVSAITAGASGNTAANTVTIFIDKPTGIEYVNNSLEISGGTDQEDDTTYRTRIRSALSKNTGKVTSSGYKQTAESVAGVAKAQVIIPGGGALRNEINVLITSTTGNGIPSAGLLAEVQAVMDSDDNRAVCDAITVIAPTSSAINMTINIIAYDTSFTTTYLESVINLAIASYLPTLNIGGTVYVVNLMNLIHDIVGIIDFTITLPAANISLAATEMAIPGTITINF